MKKLLALLLGSLFLGISLPSMASSPIEFEGYVKVYHETLANFLRGPTYGHGYLDGFRDRDNFFANKLQLKLTFRPQDNVSVFWQFRGPNYQRWGITPLASQEFGENPRDVVNIFTRALYGEIIFPWGTIRGGRIVEGLAGTAGGLASLGYAPSWGSEFLYLNPFDSGDPVDSLTYTNTWDNGFGLALYYAKHESYWGISWFYYPNMSGNFSYTGFKDNDIDVFGIEASYSWETGGFSLGLAYTRDMSNPRVEKSYAIQINPAVVQAWGPFAIHFEALLGWGKQTRNRHFDFIPDHLDNEDFYGGVGFYLDGVYTYESGNLTLAAWFSAGTDLEENSQDGYDHARRRNTLASLGDFAPFLVAYNGVTLGNGYVSNSFGWFEYTHHLVANDPNDLTNHWAIAFLGNHEITPEIKLNYGIGYFRLVHQNIAKRVNDQWVLQSKDLGLELDIGATFQILDKVSFESQFGYFFNGSAFDYCDTTNHTWRTAKDTFAWANVLTFNF
jgi:hypothetical protein